MADEVLLTDVSDKVATLTFNRPDKLNALSMDLITGSIEVLKAWSRDPEVGCIHDLRDGNFQTAASLMCD